MKLEITKQAFTDATSWAIRAVPNKPTHPLLSGIRMTVTDGALELAATDQDVFNTVSVQAMTADPGHVVVPGRLLHDIAQSFPSGRVITITGDGGHIDVDCGAAHFTLPTMDMADYPTIPSPPVTAGKIGAGVLADALESVLPAVLPDGGKGPAAIKCLCVNADGDRLTLTGTNSYRLVTCEIPWEPADTDITPFEILLPPAMLGGLVKVADAVPQVTLMFDRRPGDLPPGLAGFITDTQSMVIRLVSEMYPAGWRQKLPASFTTVAVVDVGALTEAVKRASLVLYPAEWLQLTFNAGSIQMAAGKDATSRDAIPVKYDLPWAGEAPPKISVNPQFLLDTLAAVRAPEARIGFVTPRKPMLVTPTVEDRPDEVRCLVMPAVAQ